MWKKKCKKSGTEEKHKLNGDTDKKESINKPKETNTKNINTENKQKAESSNHKTNSKSLYEKIKESIKEMNDPKRNNFRQLFFDSLCLKDKTVKPEDLNLNEDLIKSAKDLAIKIEEGRIF